jgi:DNA-binding response OmpR family regulator
VRVIIAADAGWLVDEIVAALGGPDVSFTVCTEGREVSRLIGGAEEGFDVGIFDLQIGSMGGMAVTLALRLDESADAVPHVPVLMLLDRVADVHLARRSGADGWLVKPLDPLRLERAVRAVTAGGTYREGLDGVEVAVPAPELVPVSEPELEPEPDGAEQVVPG